MELKIYWDEEKLQELVKEAVNEAKRKGFLWVDNDLISELDKLEFIKNINYYTNNSLAHEQLEALIKSL